MKNSIKSATRILASLPLLNEAGHMFRDFHYDNNIPYSDCAYGDNHPLTLKTLRSHGIVEVSGEVNVPYRIGGTVMYSSNGDRICAGSTYAGLSKEARLILKDVMGAHEGRAYGNAKALVYDINTNGIKSLVENLRGLADEIETYTE